MAKAEKSITGEIVAFNISPDGEYESFLMKDGNAIVQINLPDYPDLQAIEKLKIGKEATIQASRYDDEHNSEHPVYQLREPFKSGSGKVKRINFALHGEPNGAILANGEFIHMKPHGAKAVKLKVGQEIEFEGPYYTSASGHTVVEATIVNGIDLKHAKPKKH
jgi:hypothetical protein